MKKVLMMVMLMLLLASLNLISAEVNLWNTVIKDTASSTTKLHAFYTFDDTSARGIGKQKDIPVTFSYDVQALPFNLTGYGGLVDWCNFTIRHYKNQYGSLFGDTGELLNTTTEIQSVYFANSSLSSGKITVNMRDKDSITADMTCHYTNSSTLYAQNALIGQFATFMPSFECSGCTQYSLEDLSNQAENGDSITANSLEIYDKIQTAVSWNFQIWLILSWLLKISFIFIAVGLIFAGIYFFYNFLLEVGRGM